MIILYVKYLIKGSLINEETTDSNQD